MQAHITYNGLPSVEDATTALPPDLEWRVLVEVEKILRQHSSKFGLCLTHRHFSLEEGELMVEDTEGIMKPRLAEPNVMFYPKRWIQNGIPYEFSTQPQLLIPDNLWHKFQQLIPRDSFLGLYSPEGGPSDEERLVEFCDPITRTHYRKRDPRATDAELICTAW